MPVNRFILGAFLLLLSSGQLMSQFLPQPPPESDSPLKVGNFGLPFLNSPQIDSTLPVFGIHGYHQSNSIAELQFSSVLVTGKWRLSGYVHNKRVHLKWHLPSSAAYETVVVEYSEDGKDYFVLAYLPPFPGQEFSYDIPCAPNVNRYYRLRLRVRQGKHDVSNAIFLRSSRPASIETTQLSCESSSALFRLVRRDGIERTSVPPKGKRFLTEKIAFEEFENRRGLQRAGSK